MLNFGNIMIAKDIVLMYFSINHSVRVMRILCNMCLRLCLVVIVYRI